MVAQIFPNLSLDLIPETNSIPRFPSPQLPSALNNGARTIVTGSKHHGIDSLPAPFYCGTQLASNLQPPYLSFRSAGITSEHLSGLAHGRLGQSLYHPLHMGSYQIVCSCLCTNTFILSLAIPTDTPSQAWTGAITYQLILSSPVSSYPSILAKRRLHPLETTHAVLVSY